MKYVMQFRVFAIARKELLQIWRDPRSLSLALAVPLVLLLLFGYAISFDVKNVPLTYYDHDKSYYSRELIGKIINSGYFKSVAVPSDITSPDLLLDSGRVKLILIIPVGFAKQIYRNQTPSVQVLVDGSESNTGTIVLGYLAGIIQNFYWEIVMEIVNRYGMSSFVQFPLVSVNPRVWYNPELRSSVYIVPGIIVTVMTIITIILTSFTISRERERGTIEQLIMTPVKSYEIIIGKLLPYLLIGLVNMFIIFSVGTTVFHVPFRGNFILLILMSSLFAVCGLGIGLLISTSTRTQQLAMLVAWLTSMLPTVLLSGFVFPIKSMPPAVQIITYFIPARYFLSIVRNIFLKGNGLSVFGREAIILLIFGIISLFICTLKFKKTIN